MQAYVHKSLSYTSNTTNRDLVIQRGRGMKQPLSKLPWLSSATTSICVSDGQWGTCAHGRWRTGGGGRVINSQWWKAIVWRSLNSTIRIPAVLHTTDLGRIIVNKEIIWMEYTASISLPTAIHDYYLKKTSVTFICIVFRRYDVPTWK